VKDVLGLLSLGIVCASLGCGGGGVTFDESKKGVAKLVDDTFETALSDLAPKRFPEEALPCRSGGGTGPATGEYMANGSLEFEVPREESSKRHVRRVRDYWQEKGYDAVRVVPSGETVFAQTGGYRLSFNVTSTAGSALLGASGPCAKPDNDQELEEPPEFRALGDAGA